MSNSNQFKNLLITISEVYSEPFSQTKAKAWWSVLKEYPVSAMEEALKSHMTCPDQGMFTPKPAHIIQHMTGNTKHNKKIARFNCQIAWGDILRVAAAGLSITSHPDIDDEAKDALSIMSWRKGSSLDSFAKNEFKEAYLAVAHINILEKHKALLSLRHDNPLKLESM